MIDLLRIVGFGISVSALTFAVALPFSPWIAGLAAVGVVLNVAVFVVDQRAA